jgi:8-oxo-dGTP pyrophosphatase MutT (NUDIX family)
MIEEGDVTPENAALREVCEEIGIERSDVEILGQLTPMFTVTQFIITPLVGVIPWPYDLKENRAEVARVFGVPLCWLADPQNLETQYRQPMIPGPDIPVHFFRDYDGETIWGVTARITLNLLNQLKGIL